jgi:hypothetical protein
VKDEGPVKSESEDLIRFVEVMSAFLDRISAFDARYFESGIIE